MPKGQWQELEHGAGCGGGGDSRFLALLAADRGCEGVGMTNPRMMVWRCAAVGACWLAVFPDGELLSDPCGTGVFDLFFDL